ncbi:MAG: hydrogenase small subunit [Planctomycetota bacterium]
MATEREIPAVWLAGAACSGCSVSLLNSAAPSIRNLLLDEVVPGKHISMRFHSTIMAGQGEPTLTMLHDTGKREKGGYLLVVEGAIPVGADGKFCGIGETQKGEHLSMVEATEELGRNALAAVAIGSCSSFGGIPASGSNPTQCMSLTGFFKEKGIKTPVINIPGCPPHPDWFVGTVAHVLIHGLPGPEALDEIGRPLMYYGALIHEHCPRRAYFDAGKFAKKDGDPGCLYEIGCKGPTTYADCPTRMWNHGTNWCVGAGSPCLGCVEPEFPDKNAPLYEKINEERLLRFKVPVE